MKRSWDAMICVCNLRNCMKISSAILIEFIPFNRFCARLNRNWKAEPEPPEPFSTNRNRNRNCPSLLDYTERQGKKELSPEEPPEPKTRNRSSHSTPKPQPNRTGPHCFKDTGICISDVNSCQNVPDPPHIRHTPQGSTLRKGAEAPSRSPLLRNPPL